MSGFTSARTIQGLIRERSEDLAKEIDRYDYKQLRDDFSSKEISLFAENFQIDPITIDLANVQKTVTLGKEQVYNEDYRFYHEEQEYYEASGKHIDFKIPVTGGFEAIGLDIEEDGFEHFLDHQREYEEMNYSPRDRTIDFRLFFADGKLQGKNKSQIADIVKEESDRYYSALSNRIGKMNGIINRFNADLPALVQKTVDEKIKRGSDLDLFTEAVGISLTPKNSSQEKGKPIEIQPKKIDSNLPERKKYNGYYIGENDYAAILSTIRNHLIATETLPKAIEKLDDEELIRDTILWSLNANYIVATGESFRNQGKSDICIAFKEKSAFVAECKIWRGEKYVSEAIDQLLSYTTWRDSKAAIIVFNLETQDFKTVCEKLKAIALSHPKFKALASTRSPNEFECAFFDSNNPDSTISITFFAANYVVR